MIWSVSVSSISLDVGRSLHEGLYMFWETLWALVLGFTLSGIVQAFVSKDQMRAKLGTHRPSAVARASGYGMMSSSCSYAASAMSKSLFAKGADFTSAMIFMVASTNLVVELGVVMLVLLGWQFAVAEFVGGPIMITLLALGGSVVFTAPVVARALKRVRDNAPEGHDHESMTKVSEQRQEELDGQAWTKKLHSPAAWSDASNYAVADVTMLRRELVIGYVVAGFLATLVSNNVWNALFLHGHGFWTSAENALVGPLIAVVSWVCSIGNVPLAAALWSGGISFGGVIAFIFADLIAMPLILIYRKFYGWRLTLRVVALFYVVMTIAGLATEGIFRATRAIPSHRAFGVSTGHFSWNYTTYLNIIFIVVALGVTWFARNRARFGGGEGYAIDPVCAMQVRVADAPAQTVHHDTTVYFCSDRCRERYDADPERFSSEHPEAHSATPMVHADDTEHQASAEREGFEEEGDEDSATDPVCGMTVQPAMAAAHRVHEGRDFWFCGVGCAEQFDANEERYTLLA